MYKFLFFHNFIMLGYCIAKASSCWTVRFLDSFKLAALNTRVGPSRGPQALNF